MQLNKINESPSKEGSNNRSGVVINHPVHPKCHMVIRLRETAT